MFDDVPARVWLLLLIAIWAYHPAHYLLRHWAASPGRRDITQPPEDLSWRSSSDLIRSSVILVALGGLAIFIFTPAAEKFAQTPSFWPILMVCFGAWALLTVPRGIATGQVEPFVRGLSDTYDRHSQPKRFWASILWNGVLGAACIGLAYPMYTDTLRQAVEDRCYYHTDGTSSRERLSACNKLINRPGQAGTDLADAFSGRGAAYYRLSDYRRALVDHSKAVSLDPGEPRHFFNRALAYEALGDVRRAVSDYSAAIRLRPDDGDALLYRGLIYLDTGRLDEAIADFTRLQELRPKSAWPLANRGIAYAYKNDAARAEADFRAARVIDPNNPGAFRGEALLAMNSGNLNVGVERLTASLKRDPQNAWALAMRAEAYRRLGQHEKARADSDKVAKLTKDAP